MEGISSNQNPLEENSNKAELFDFAKTLTLRRNMCEKTVLDLIKNDKKIEEIQKIFIKHLKELKGFQSFSDNNLHKGPGRKLSKENQAKYDAYKEYFKLVGYNTDNYQELNKFEESLEDVLLWCESASVLQQTKGDPDILNQLDDAILEKEDLIQLQDELHRLENDGNKLAKSTKLIIENSLSSRKRKSVAEIRQNVLAELISGYNQEKSKGVNKKVLFKQFLDVQNLIQTYLKEEDTE
jgi:hypothetical protein